MNKDSNRFIRFQAESYEGYGCIIDNKAYPIKGDIFGSFTLVAKRLLGNLSAKRVTIGKNKYILFNNGELYNITAGFSVQISKINAGGCFVTRIISDVPGFSV